MKKTTVYEVTLAALLHDIGKFYQRTGNNYRDFALAAKISNFCPEHWKQGYSHIHSLYTAQFWYKYLKPWASDELVALSARHHKPQNELEQIITDADHLSSKMDRDNDFDDNTNWGNFKTTRLKPIFAHISNINTMIEQKNTKLSYRLQAIDCEKPLFPQTQAKQSIAASEKAYDYLFNDFVKDLAQIKTQNSLVLINRLLGLLEKYTTFIPATTMQYPISSLYDHLRTTAAIAACLFVSQKQAKPFLLLEGDISGIQSFIYQVTEGEETRSKVAKSLRGRSVYINMLTDFLSHYIVEELKLSELHILYAGGGNFELLLPNTPQIRTRLTEICEKIQVYLFKQYRTRLGIVFAQLETNAKGMSDYASTITELKTKIAEEKQHKFLNLMEQQNFFVSEQAINKPCSYCGVNSGPICKSCEELIKLGERIIKPEARYLTYDFSAQKLKNALWESKLGNLGTMAVLTTAPDVPYLFHLNQKGNLGRAKYMGDSIPRFKDSKEVASFSDIAECSQGDHLIGVLKMDVDNLGVIFGYGLEDNNRSISQVAMLSRLIDLFFSGYINAICKDVSKEYLNSHPQCKINEIFYINYAGGDDLLIIGPYEQTIVLAQRIRKEFGRFVANNPNITLSAGIYIADEKEAIRISSQAAEELLSQAKASPKGKDKVALLNEVMSWSNAEDSLEKRLNQVDLMTTYLNTEQLSRGLVYRMMLMSKEVRRQNSAEVMRKMPGLAYAIARNVKNKGLKKQLIADYITVDLKNSKLLSSELIFMLTLLKTRRRESNV